MQDPDVRITRRTALKGAAVGSVGVVVGSSLAEQVAKLGGALPEMSMTPNEEWFAQRAWSVSANKVVPRADGTTSAVTTLARRIEHPTSAEEIAAMAGSAEYEVHPVVNNALSTLTALDAWCSGRLRWPAGGSIILVGRKPEITP